MSISENRYVLKQITKSSEEDFINAIHIYLNETPKEIRTNTNEIASWLDKKTVLHLLTC